MQERTIHHHTSRQYVFALGYALQYISSLVKIKTLAPNFAVKSGEREQVLGDLLSIYILKCGVFRFRMRSEVTCLFGLLVSQLTNSVFLSHQISTDHQPQPPEQSQLINVHSFSKHIYTLENLVLLRLRLFQLSYVTQELAPNEILALNYICSSHSTGSPDIN